MTLNLITDPWIPARTSSDYRRIRPAEIVSSDLVAIASCRPDFDSSLYEFLIGLLQTAATPDDEADWREWFRQPPEASEIDRLLRPVVPAFHLTDAPHPFLQETGLHGEPGKPIDGLLIDTPGNETVEDNKDLFVKRREDASFCLACCAQSLITLQSFSPAGGAGHRTSLRGGGPISTILIGTTLWETVWMNVLPATVFGAGRLGAPDAKALPWLNPPIPPNAERPEVFSQETHAAIVFWGMPRRLLLGPGQTHGHCVLCGEQGYVLREYHRRPYGFKYAGPWRHSLSPTQEIKGDLSTRKGRSDLGGYRNWVGLVAASADGTHRPATVVQHYRAERGDLLARAFRLRASGFAMDNAKVKGWYEGVFRHLLPGDSAMVERVDAHARALVAATEQAAYLLKSACRAAWFDRPKDAKGDIGHLAAPLWTRTEDAFFASLQRVAQDSGGTGEERRAWALRLSQHSLEMFASYVPLLDLGDCDPRRVIAAEAKLLRQLRTTLPKKLDIGPEEMRIEVVR